MTQLAVTVIGHDRPGIIAETTRALAGLGANLEDSSMTILRGHFAMVLVASVDADATAVESALAGLTDDGTLSVSVRAVPEEDLSTALGSPYLLSVHGADRPGIVSALTAEVAAVGGNVTDLTTRLTGELYVLLAEVDLPPSVDLAALDHRLGDVARGLGVQVSLRELDPDVL
jgi:glycine cleavage system transcriptional repressor